MSILDELRMAREALGWSHAEVSRRMGRDSSASQICGWERGQQSPRLTSLEDWATALGRAVATTAAQSVGPLRSCVICGSRVNGLITRKYCKPECARQGAADRRAARRATAPAPMEVEPDPLAAAAIRAVHNLYGGSADEVVHALGLDDPAAVAYARRVCGEVSP